MKITSLEFVKSAFSMEHLVDDGLPEVAFLGRSNVGKSSLINSLLKRKGIARTSNTPGRTQSINYFRVNESFYFVDLPGYGYARVSKAMRSDWGVMAEEYLSQREELTLCIQLIDARHVPTKLDIQLNEWLVFNQKKHIVVATKSDKLSNNQLPKQLKEIGLAIRGGLIMPYSSETGQGHDALWTEIGTAIKNVRKK